MKIRSQTNSAELFMNEVKNIYTEYGKILDGHKKREAHLSKKYNSIFLGMMTGNMCNYTEELKFKFDCSTFMNSILQQGLHSTEIMIGEIFRHKYEQSVAINDSLTDLLESEEFKRLGNYVM
jgi:hypothetical protein